MRALLSGPRRGDRLGSAQFMLCSCMAWHAPPTPATTHTAGHQPGQAGPGTGRAHPLPNLTQSRVSTNAIAMASQAKVPRRVKMSALSCSTNS